MDVFGYWSYKALINDWVALRPRNGHGEYRRIANALDVTSVAVSQVFKGTRDLSPEQALKLCRHIGLRPLETEYFLLLVQYERAGSHDLKQFNKSRIIDLQSKASKLKNRVEHKTLNEDTRAIFYSSWQYSAVRLASSLNSVKSKFDIQNVIDIDPPKLQLILEFLLTSGLIVEDRNGLRLGPSVTHVGNDSAHVQRHHMNWRVKALQTLEKEQDGDLHYTGPMALSEKDTREVLSLLQSGVQKVTDLAKSSRSETLRCLTIDWFRIN